VAIADRFRRLATGAAVAGWVFAGALGVLAPPTAMAAPSHVGLVINGQGYCLPAGGTGYDLLDRSGAGVVIAQDPAHVGMVQRIGGVPSATTAIDAEHYWSYWRNSGSGWSYSGAGGGSSRPAAGTVDGWSYVDGSASAEPPAVLSYGALCAGSDAPAPPVATEPAQTVPAPPPAAEPAPTAREPAPADRTPSGGGGGQPDRTSAVPPESGASQAQPDPTDAPPTVAADGSPSPGPAGSPSRSTSGGPTARTDGTVLGARDGGSGGDSDGGGGAATTVGVLALAAALAGGAIWQSRRRSG
jgi:hypothetical protein